MSQKGGQSILHTATTYIASQQHRTDTQTFQSIHIAYQILTMILESLMHVKK
jgi:hypothetical protein